MKRISLYTVPAALAVLALAACGSSGPKSVPNDSVAVVGDQTITKAQFDTLLKQAETGYKKQKRKFPKPGSTEYNQLQSQIMQFLLQRSEFSQRANDLGIKISDKQVNQRLGDLIQQYFRGNHKKYEQQLKANGYTEAQVKDNIRSQLLSEAIYNKVTGNINVSDTDVKKYYAEHKQQYTTPETRNIRHILLKTRALANKVYRQLKSGANFAALARKYSQDPGSRALGGRLTVQKGQTVAPFDKVAFSLKTGQLSEPVHTDFGYHIIQALGPIKPPKVTPLAQVKQSIRAQLQQSKRQGAMTKWVDDTRKDFCDGKLNFQAGFKPSPDPCTTSSTTSTATTTTG